MQDGPYTDFSHDFRDDTYWYWLLKEYTPLSLQDILVENNIKKAPSNKLTNYLLIIRKLYIWDWDCRRSQILPNKHGSV